ncbi:MAG TPA: hypothetical protein VHP83_15435 [Aggregatilineaceae bacterium]|nr:hypothetical protein [Aggregatilineaceae bacterium]
MAHIAFDDILSAASSFSREGQVFKHLNIRKYILITQMRGAELYAQDLDTPGFGHVKIKVFNALDCARKAAKS